jgi:hypothetical protein
MKCSTRLATRQEPERAAQRASPEASAALRISSRTGCCQDIQKMHVVPFSVRTARCTQRMRLPWQGLTADSWRVRFTAKASLHRLHPIRRPAPAQYRQREHTLSLARRCAQAAKRLCRGCEAGQVALRLCVADTPEHVATRQAASIEPEKYVSSNVATCMLFCAASRPHRRQKTDNT